MRGSIKNDAIQGHQRISWTVEPRAGDTDRSFIILGGTTVTPTLEDLLPFVEALVSEVNRIQGGTNPVMALANNWEDELG